MILDDISAAPSQTAQGTMLHLWCVIPIPKIMLSFNLCLNSSKISKPDVINLRAENTIKTEKS